MRGLVGELGLRPVKSLGQNFVVDPNTVRRVVAAAGVTPGERILEVGPGLGSLTLGLLDAGASVVAVEVDATLSAALPTTVAGRLPAAALDVLTTDAARLGVLPGRPPVALVANLPYRVAVPVLLHLLATVPSLERGLVMVQLEVAERLVAPPGSRTYGVPSVKAAWWAQLELAGRVGRSVFWPEPNVDSALVRFTRRRPPAADRAAVFAVVDAAFAQRRKTLRAALAPWAGSPAEAERRLRAAGIDPSWRGEQLTVADFARLAGSG